MIMLLSSGTLFQFSSQPKSRNRGFKIESLVSPNLSKSFISRKFWLIAPQFCSPKAVNDQRRGN
uniref:Uncharacterized protein n=1 Tax=Arundo donax TaxID=35708 RepID=A0A0A8XQF9_ARUDO